MHEGDVAPTGERAWGESVLSLPENLRGAFVNVLTGEKHSLQGKLALARLLGRFPVALLANA